MRGVDEAGVRMVLRPRFCSQTAQRPTFALVLLETAGLPEFKFQKLHLASCRGRSCSLGTWVCKSPLLRVFCRNLATTSCAFIGAGCKPPGVEAKPPGRLVEIFFP